MNTNLSNILNFTKKFEVIVNEAKTIGMNPEMTAHICALDPTFSSNVKMLLEMLTVGTEEETSEDETSVEETIEETTEETTEEETTETETTEETLEETSEETPEEITETTNSEWRHHPCIEGLELSPDGRARVAGNEVNIIMTAGYARGYNKITRKQFQLATEMLVTFMGPTPAGCVPVYKDGDRSNCSISNLCWGRRDPSLSTSQVERACKLIAENPNLSENDLVNLLVAEHTIRSSGALKSILKGNYKTISDKYFIVRRGSIIPMMTTTTDTEDNNMKGILSLSKDPKFIKDLATEKLQNGGTISKNDVEALVLAYVMEGATNPEKIQKGLRKDFGRKLMIPNSMITNVIGKGVK